MQKRSHYGYFVLNLQFLFPTCKTFSIFSVFVLGILARKCMNVIVGHLQSSFGLELDAHI